MLSGGMGYRFAETLTVQYADPPLFVDIMDTAGAGDVRDPNDLDDLDVSDEAELRQKWILDQLAEGVQLKAPMVASQFKRSRKTAQRDLDALRELGMVKYHGNAKTGYYRIKNRS